MRSPITTISSCDSTLRKIATFSKLLPGRSITKRFCYGSNRESRTLFALSTTFHSGSAVQIHGMRESLPVRQRALGFISSRRSDEVAM
jgi:hypothetical protein